MSLAETIARYKRELRADPASLRFVPLAEALRKANRLGEAERVLADGLMHHPGLNSARLVLARVQAQSGRRAEALVILDDLYPRDTGNVALVSLYLELLVEAGRADEARVLLDRAELIGVPEDLRERVRDRLETELWRDRRSQEPEIVPLGMANDSREALLEPITLPDASLASLGDPFAIPRVAARLEAAGQLEAALRTWEEIAAFRPATPGVVQTIAELRRRIELKGRPADLISVDLADLLPLRRPVPGPAGMQALRQLRARLRGALSQ